MSAEEEMVASEEMAAEAGIAVEIVLTEEERAALLQQTANMQAMLAQSQDSINNAHTAEHLQPPDVGAVAVIRLAADEQQQAAALADLLQPTIDAHLERLGVADVAIMHTHYTSVHTLLAWRLAFVATLLIMCM